MMTFAPYKVEVDFALYAAIMENAGDLRVSDRGQMSLPAAARHRWQLDDGGRVGYLDLGDAIVIVPGGVDELRAELLGSIDWNAVDKGFGDPELATQ